MGSAGEEIRQFVGPKTFNTNNQEELKNYLITLLINVLMIIIPFQSMKKILEKFKPYNDP